MGSKFAWIKFTTKRKEKYIPGFVYEDNQAQYILTNGGISDFKYNFVDFKDKIEKKFKGRIAGLKKFNCINQTSFE